MQQKRIFLHLYAVHWIPWGWLWDADGRCYDQQNELLLHTIQAHCHWRPNTPRPSDGHCTPVWSLRSPHTTDVQGYRRRLKHYIQNKHLNTDSSRFYWQQHTVVKKMNSLQTPDNHYKRMLLMLQEAKDDIKKNITLSSGIWK